MTNHIIHREDTPEFERRRGTTHIQIVNDGKHETVCDVPFSQCLDCPEHNGCERYHKHRRGK